MRATEELGGQDLYSTWGPLQEDRAGGADRILQNLAEKDSNKAAPVKMGLSPVT